jgi:hypothetical protein
VLPQLPSTSNSPRNRRPAGKEGVFLGFAHMNTFFAWIFGFIFSGYLLRAYCPEPSSLPEAVQQARLAWLAGNGPMPEAYASAQNLWWAYALIGATSFAAMIVYILVTNHLDRNKPEEAAA